jgi:hypothetical protein
MQRVLALAGKKGSGKDTLAEMLKPNFQRASFADPLYLEVQIAFGLEDQELLRDRETKELPTPRMALSKCQDVDFIQTCQDLGMDDTSPNSPRKILQIWGTEYRQVKNGPTYWSDKLVAFLDANRDTDYCIPDMRFPHEYSALLEYSMDSNFDDEVQFDCVKIVREVEDDSTSGHVSENALEGFDIYEVEVQNVDGDPEAMLRSLKHSFLV